MSNAYFEIKPAAGGQFRFNLKAPNHEIILTGESYASNQGCRNGIASVRSHARINESFVRIDNPGNYRFNLKADNGKIIGTSESYTTAQSRDGGIEAVKKYAPVADIKDLS